MGIPYLLPAVIILCYLTSEHCVASPKKTSCTVQDGRADCSRLSLTAVPSDLPRNITSLDMSHNRLVRMPTPSLTPYGGLLHLNVGFNSITKLDQGLCQTLSLLQTLNAEHNEVHVLQKEDVIHCTNLTGLNLASNRLKLVGEPFLVLQVCVSIRCLCYANRSWREKLMLYRLM